MSVGNHDSMPSFRRANRGASPVVGNILMVGVVVILGAVLTLLSFGFLTGLEDPAPQAAFDGEFTADGDLVLTHTDGDTVPASALVVKASDGDSTRTLGTWESLAGSGGDVAAGDNLRLSGFNGDETVRVVWEAGSGDRSATLQTFATRGVDAPVSDAEVVEGTTAFASQDNAFGDKAWQCLARIEESNWALSTSQNDQPDNDDQQEKYDWQNGQTVPFTIEYNDQGNEIASLAVDGRTAFADTTTYPATGDTIGITLKVDSDTSGTVEVESLRLDGLPLSTASASAGTGESNVLLVNDDSIGDGFVLTGDVTFSWSGAKPSNSEMQLNVEIEEAGTGQS